MEKVEFKFVNTVSIQPSQKAKSLQKTGSYYDTIANTKKFAVMFTPEEVVSDVDTVNSLQKTRTYRDTTTHTGWLR